MYDPESAMKWRLRAEELRARAEATTDPVAARTYAQLADEWSRKAEIAETPPSYLGPLKGAE